MIDLNSLSVQFIAHPTPRYDYVAGIQLALEGGCRWIQLRMKGADTDEVLHVGRIVEPLCRRFGATFLVDDHAELVQALHADGVHLGKNDLPIREARRLLGAKYIIGGTANTFEDIRRLAHDGADYIGCGPFRFTTTKSNLSPCLGLTGYDELLQRMREEEIRLPLVAIGGITRADLPDLMALGVEGIALSGSVLRADDPKSEMQQVVQTVRQARARRDTKQDFQEQHK